MALLRRASTVASLTLASRLLGFARDAGVAALFGTGLVADASVAGLSLAQLSRRLLGEGALNAAVLPAIAGAQGAARRRRAGAALLLFAAAGLALAGLLWLFMPQVIAVLAPGFPDDGERVAGAVHAGRLTVICVPLALVAGTLAALANAGGALARPAMAPAAANVAVLILLGLLWLAGAHEMAPAVALAWLAAGVIAGAVTQVALIFAAVPAGTLALPSRGALRAALPMLAAAGPSLFAAGLPQLRFLIAAAAASTIPGGVAALFYATRLVELPLGLIGASAGAVLLPALAARDEKAGTVEAQGMEAALALSLPAALGLAVLAHPIVVVLFQRGAFGAEAATLTATTLSCLALTLPLQALEKILAAIAFAAGFGRDVTRAALIGLPVGALAGFLTAGPLGLAGPAFGVLAASLVSLALLAGALARRGRLPLPAASRRRLIGLGAAGLAMAGTILLAARLLAAPLAAGGLIAAGTLACLVLTGMLTYGATAFLCGGLSPAALKAGLRNR
ncbi:lipid II flippase MurJ [Ancylobacter radicis]|uniref:Polysaccharide biosynthesis C-terminal domain-containing protein n=1 Tax=Ancylobacter radicis TaxID=2836179 RepID=A0ABS5R6I9_9HYPH|nr:lipid II flippase MurJ [Ancylobacter radicis]MBS9477288.1 polysaccharide biosynthesis C-terminal domain-containing protein [Ancylobacter radicis]